MTTDRPPPRLRRYAIAAVAVLLAAATAAALPVRGGEAAVVTRLGKPVRVVLEPGLNWTLPPPIDRTRVVDLRLHTTATGNHGVLTRDGLSLVVQAWAGWRVARSEEAVLAHLRATGGDADATASQLRTLLNSALETVTGRYAMTDLVNTDAEAVRLAAYEHELRERVAVAAASTLGIEVAIIGVERLLLPETTLQATVTRMAEERRVAAEERQAAGRRSAGEIRAAAERDARIMKAEAEQQAAAIEARARAEAAAVYGAAHAADPALYAWLRSLDALEASLGGNARLILSTAAPPFQALVTPPPMPSAEPLPAPEAPR